MSEIAPTDPTGGSHYKSQYRVTPAFRKYWETVFHGAHLTNKEISELTDTFVKNVTNSMNQTLNWALQQQKKRDQKEKEEG